MTIETQRIETATANTENANDSRRKLSDEFNASVHQKAQTSPEAKSPQDNNTAAPAASNETKTAGNTNQSDALPNFSIVHDGANAELSNATFNDDKITVAALGAKFQDAIKHQNWTTADAAAQLLRDETQKQMQQISEAKVSLDKYLDDTSKMVAAETDPTEKTALEARLATQKKLEADVQQALKLDKGNLAFLSYCQGFEHLAARNTAQANKDFKAIAEIDPETAKRLNENPPQGLPKLDEMIKESEEPTFWESTKHHLYNMFRF